MVDRVPVAGPWITDREVSYVAEAARTAWYDRAGEWVSRFETAFATACDRTHALALPSCTAGIHLSLAAAGIGPGDEVVVPDLTWIATAAPISYVGATPVFADVDRSTWCLSASTVEAVLTDRTRAVIAVDLYGTMPDLDGLERLCDERGLILVEDAAEAIGGAIGDRRAGSFGRTSVFSFHGSKTLVTGEGGLVLTDDDELAESMRVLRDHGRRVGDTSFTNDRIGFKYRMTDLQAALGLAQLERVDELVERKRTIFEWYRTRLSAMPGITMNPEPEGTTSGCWMTTVVLDPRVGLHKETLRAQLGEEGIDTRPFFSPLSSLPAYAGVPTASAAAARNRAAYEIGPYGVNLPSSLMLDEPSVERVCDVLRSIVQRR